MGEPAAAVQAVLRGPRHIDVPEWVRHPRKPCDLSAVDLMGHFHRLGVNDWYERRHLVLICFDAIKELGFACAKQTNYVRRVGRCKRTLYTHRQRFLARGWIWVRDTQGTHETYVNWEALRLLVAEVASPNQRRRRASRSGNDCQSPSLEDLGTQPTRKNEKQQQSAPPPVPAREAVPPAAAAPSRPVPRDPDPDPAAGEGEVPAPAPQPVLAAVSWPSEARARELDGPAPVRPPERPRARPQARVTPVAPRLAAPLLTLPRGAGAVDLLARENFSPAVQEWVVDRVMAYDRTRGVQHAAKFIRGVIGDARAGECREAEAQAQKAHEDWERADRKVAQAVAAQRTPMPVSPPPAPMPPCSPLETHAAELRALLSLKYGLSSARKAELERELREVEAELASNSRDVDRVPQKTDRPTHAL
jgi:hypothetical protein